MIRFLSPGRAAERRAAVWLRRRGFVILSRNVRIGRGEIDIVAIERGVVVLVEVRFRRAGLAAAGDSIGPDKRRALLAAARGFRSRERLWGTPMRIDLVVVTRRGRRWVIEHLPDGLGLTRFLSGAP